MLRLKIFGEPDRIRMRWRSAGGAKEGDFLKDFDRKKRVWTESVSLGGLIDPECIL